MKIYRPIFLSAFVAHKLMCGYLKRNAMVANAVFEKSLSNLMNPYLISTENELVCHPTTLLFMYPTRKLQDVDKRFFPPRSRHDQLFWGTESLGKK